MANDLRITLFPNEPAEKPMRNILGINNSPRIQSKVYTNREKPLFDALHFRYIRYHDAPLENPGQQLIDIHRIFPLFHLDENDPRNYCFGQTDDYLSVIADSGAEIDFRVGETIDHSGNARLIGVPDDIAKWARICRNIIAHYKDGKWNGLHLNITRVSVWEEPDNSALLNGTVEQYSEMFCTLYKLLKEDYPDLKVGGPTMMGGSISFLSSWLAICKQNNVTPDFCSLTLYQRHLDVIHQSTAQFKAAIDAAGFPEIPIVVAEWHYAPFTWKNTREVSAAGFNTAESAAYTASLLTDWMDDERLEAAYYYAWATSVWSVMDFFSPKFSPLPVYYGLSYFQNLAVDCSERIRMTVEAENSENLPRLLAGKTADGKLRLLISCFGCNPCRIDCAAGTAKSARLRTVSLVFDEAQARTGETILAEDGQFTVWHNGQYGVYLLEIEE